MPKKLDHFVITTIRRDEEGHLISDADLMLRLKPDGGHLTEIPIRLLYDDINMNFQTRYACYSGKNQK